MDIADVPTATHFAEIHVGLAEVIHAFAHGHPVIMQGAQSGLIQMNLDLPSRYRRQGLEVLLGETNRESRIELPYLVALGNKFLGKHSKTVNLTPVEIRRYDDHFSLRFIAPDKLTHL